MKCYWSEQIKEKSMDETWSACGGHEKCLRGISRKLDDKDHGKHRLRLQCNIKMDVNYNT